MVVTTQKCKVKFLRCFKTIQQSRQETFPSENSNNGYTENQTQKFQNTLKQKGDPYFLKTNLKNFY